MKKIFSRGRIKFVCPISAAFFSLLFCQLASAQQDLRVFSGKVVSQQGIALSGVNIVVQGSTSGTTTDNSGNFSLQAPPNAVLEFSSVGFARLRLRGAAGMSVTLTELASTLDSVTVYIGYGTQKRKDVTGSVASLKGEEIRNLPATNIEEALQGRLAGVQVTKSSGQPGTNADILIRGISSLNNASPLYIVDGVRSSGDNINLNDVASVDVLKDASAAAIYGAAAAGGVIVITTKKGLHGKPAVHVGARYGSTRPLVLELLDRDNYVKLQRLLNPSYLQGQDISALPNTDWTKALYSNGREENYNASVSGGSDHNSYLISAFYNGQKGVYIDNASYLSGVRINSDYNLSKDVKIGEQVYAYERNTNPPQSNPAPNPPFRTEPIMAIYDTSNVAGGGFGKTPPGFQGGNAVGQELTYFEKDRDFGLQANAYIEVKLPFSLAFRSTIAYGTFYGDQNKFQNTYDFGSNVNTSNYLEKASSHGNSLLNNYTLSFDHSFGNHHINALIGYEQIRSTSDNIDVKQTDQALQPNYSFFPTSTSQVFNPSGTYDPNGLIKSQFARLNYDFNSTYYISAAIRRDADFTKFGPGNQHGIFPSVSAGWRITQAPFFEQMRLAWLDELKLRASYGVIGNSSIPAYYFLSSFQTIGAQNFTPDGTRNIGVGQNNLPNSDIKWESLYETNIGLDAQLFNSHLSATIEWYDKTTKNVLYAIPIPSSAGLGSTFQTNIGSVNNKGLEIVLGYSGQAGRIGYRISVNGAFNKNKVISLDGINKNPFFDGSTDIGGGYGIMTGNPISSTQAGRSFAEFYGYRTEGIYSTQKQIDDHPQFAGDTARLGDLIFQDVNKDGKLTADDRTLIGNPNPKLIYGININLNYKAFDIALLFNGVAGVQLFNGVKAYAQDIFSDGNTTTNVFNASFLGTNEVTTQPRIGYFQSGTSTFIADPNGNYSKPNSYFVENGSYLKLKNLQFGYTFSGPLMSKAHLQGARLFVMGNNLLTFTKYSGLDPELSGSVTAHGIDNANAYPHTRIYTVGLDINF